MIYEITDNYGTASTYRGRSIEENLCGFKFHKETSTIEIDSIVDINLLIEIFGKILITKNKIIYYVD